MATEASFRFDDSRNITIGVGRIIYAQETVYDGAHEPYKGKTFAEGWVLPGGRRTTDRAEAEAVAKAIDEFARRARSR